MIINDLPCLKWILYLEVLSYAITLGITLKLVFILPLITETILGLENNQ